MTESKIVSIKFHSEGRTISVKYAEGGLSTITKKASSHKAPVSPQAMGECEAIRKSYAKWLAGGEFLAE